MPNPTPCPNLVPSQRFTQVIAEQVSGSMMGEVLGNVSIPPGGRMCYNGLDAKSVGASCYNSRLNMNSFASNGRVGLITIALATTGWTSSSNSYEVYKTLIHAHGQTFNDYFVRGSRAALPSACTPTQHGLPPTRPPSQHRLPHAADALPPACTPSELCASCDLDSACIQVLGERCTNGDLWMNSCGGSFAPLPSPLLDIGNNAAIPARLIVTRVPLVGGRWAFGNIPKS